MPPQCPPVPPPSKKFLVTALHQPILHKYKYYWGEEKRLPALVVRESRRAERERALVNSGRVTISNGMHHSSRYSQLSGLARLLTTLAWSGFNNLSFPMRRGGWSWGGRKRNLGLSWGQKKTQRMLKKVAEYSRMSGRSCIIL